jgi:hypothetical protein
MGPQYHRVKNMKKSVGRPRLHTPGAFTPVTVNLPTEVVKRLDDVATFSQRSRAWVIRDVLTTYIAEQFRASKVPHTATPEWEE